MDAGTGASGSRREVSDVVGAERSRQRRPEARREERPLCRRAPLTPQKSASPEELTEETSGVDGHKLERSDSAGESATGGCE